MRRRADYDPAAVDEGRRFRAGLLAITAVGAAWRVLYLFLVKADDPLLLNDSLYYSIQAGRNSEGDWFREALTDQPGAEHGPLTSLYLTPWSLGSGANILRQRFAMTLIGIAVVPAIGLVGRRFGGWRVGLVAAAIAAAYPNLWVSDSLVMSEPLAILLVAAALAVALELDGRSSLARAVALGVLTGLGALARSEVALFALGFAAVAWWRAAGHRRRGWVPVLVLGATALTILPWTAYNLIRFERPVYLSTNGEGVLIGANCDLTYFDDIGGWDIRCLPLAAGEPDGDTSVRAALRREAAFDYIGDHVDRLPVVVAARLGRTLDVYGLDSVVGLDVREEKARWAVWAGIVCWWLLAPTAAVGWWLARHSERGRANRWWLAVTIVAVLVTTVLFYGAHRIRAPAEPAVVVLAAFAAVTSLERRRPPRAFDAPVGSPVHVAESGATGDR